MNRTVDIEIKGNNSASPAFAEVAAGLRKIADDTRALRAEEKLEIEQQKKLTELIKADRQEKEEAARQQQKLTDLIKADRAAREEAIRKEGQAIEAATLGPYEKYLSAQFKLADLRKKGVIGEQAHAAALEQEKQKYLQLATSAGKVNPVLEAKRQADAAATKAAKESKAAEDERKRALQQTGDAIRNSVLTPIGSYKERVRELNKALRDGAIDQKTHAAAVRKAGADYRAAKGGGIGGMLSGAASRIAAPIVATVGVAAITREIRESFTELDELAKRADKLSVIPAELQKLQYAAGLSGVEVGTLESSIQSYVKRTGDADRITDKTSAALGKLKINASELKNLSLPEEMRRLADGFAGITDGEERLSLAMQLFGESGGDMLNMLAQGSDALDDLFREREGLGGLFSREDLAGVEAANDAMDRAATALGGAMQEAAIALAPVVEDLSNSLTEWLKNRRADRTEKEAQAADYKKSSELGKDVPFANAGSNLGLFYEKEGWKQSKLYGEAPSMAYNPLDTGMRYSGWGSWQQVAQQNLSPEQLAQIGKDTQAQWALEDKQAAETPPPPPPPANQDGHIPFSPFAAARGLAGTLNKAAGDGASLLDRGTDAAGLLGPAANKWLRNARGEMEGIAERADDRVKEAQRAEKDLKSAAERILRQNRTPEQIFLEEKKKAEDLFKAGLLPRDVVDREIKRAGEDRDRALESLKDKDGKGKGKREGIPEPLQAVVSRTLTRGSGADPALKAQQDTAKSTKEVVIESKKLVGLMKEIAGKPPAAVPAVAGAT